MKIILFLLILLPFFSFSQKSNVDSLLTSGVKFFDEQQFDLAISEFQKVLKMEPKNEVANYELALTLMSVKDYEGAIKYSDIVIELKEKNYMNAYLIKGSSLDELGRTEESIQLFEKAIKKYGDHHLLCYNLGMDYYRLGQLEKAQAIVERGIKTKKSHASSHMLLGYLLADQGMKVRSVMALNYFLLLEPSTKRSEKAYALLMKQMDGHSNLDDKNHGTINIYVNPNADPEFSSAELMLSMLSVNYTLEENKDKSREEMFVENSKSLFTVLAELKKKKNKGLYWDFYVPFFDELSQSTVFPTYCYYISGYSNEMAGKWLEEHPEQLQELADWFQKDKK